MNSINILKKLSLLFIILFTFELTYSQENYLSGYIIKLNGDTLHGYVDYRNWDINPNKISFKSMLFDEKSIYTPTNIKEFGVKNEVYESGNIEFETSLNNTNDLSRSSILVFEKDQIFLQTLIKGNKSLYLYKNKYNRKEQFYIKKDSTFVLLMYKKYLKIIPYQSGVPENIIVSENKKYIGQLSLYFQDCPRVYSKIANTEYNLKSLVNLFNLYYDYTQSDISYQKKKEKLSLETGLFVGISETSLKFAYKFSPYLDKSKYNLSTDLTTGFFVNIKLPRNQGRWSIYNEFMYSSYKINGYYKDSSNYVHDTYNSTIGYSYIKMNNLFRYKFPINQSYIYLNAGISNGFAFSEINYLNKERVLFGVSTFNEGKAIEESKRYEIGYLVGLGAIFNNKYSLEFRFELGNGMSANQGLNSFVNRYFLLFAYKL